MKRLFILLSILLITLLALSACVVNIPTFSALPSGASLLQTPAPTPTPKPRVIAVFGAENATAFLDGVSSAAADSGIEVVVVKGGIEALSTYAPEEDAAAIVYITRKSQAIPPASIPVYAYASTGQSVSGGVFYLGYDGANEAQLALTSAIEYPPHLTPVRMIGLFTSQTSAAYTIYANAKAAGQVFSKMEYFEDSNETSSEISSENSAEVSPEAALEGWLSDAFSRYYPGMLDAVYAETGALAITAADVLASLGRSDIEVFSAATDAQAESKLSPILVCIVGANEHDAGARCFAEAKKLLEGEKAQSGILLPETIWYSPAPN